MIRLNSLVMPAFFCNVQCSGQPTIFPGEDWKTALSESQGIDGTRLVLTAQHLNENAGHNGIDELFIVRNGYVIREGDSVDKVHGV